MYQHVIWHDLSELDDLFDEVTEVDIACNECKHVWIEMFTHIRCKECGMIKPEPTLKEQKDE